MPEQKQMPVPLFPNLKDTDSAQLAALLHERSACDHACFLLLRSLLLGIGAHKLADLMEENDMLDADDRDDFILDLKETVDTNIVLTNKMQNLIAAHDTVSRVEEERRHA